MTPNLKREHAKRLWFSLLHGFAELLIESEANEGNYQIWNKTYVTQSLYYTDTVTTSLPVSCLAIKKKHILELFLSNVNNASSISYRYVKWYVSSVHKSCLYGVYYSLLSLIFWSPKSKQSSSVKPLPNISMCTLHTGVFLPNGVKLHYWIQHVPLFNIFDPQNSTIGSVWYGASN